MDDKKKTLYLALAGVGALIGAALMFHWANQGESEEMSHEELMKDLKDKKLDQPAKQGNGMLDP